MRIFKLRRQRNKAPSGMAKRVLRIVLIIFIIAVSALPAVYLNSPYGYVPLFTVVFTLALSFAYLVILRKNISFKELSDLTSCQRKTKIDFTVNIKNTSILVFPKIEAFFYISDLFGGDDTITKSVFTLSSKEDRNFDFSVRFDHIGTYSAGLRMMRVYDPLGIFSFTLKNAKQYFVEVTPKIYDLSSIDVSDTVFVETQKALTNCTMEGSDYTGVREYAYGDPIKTIHWKLSAHTNGYVTKILETYGNTAISIIMDFVSPEYDSETLMNMFDCIVETGLSIGNYAQGNGMDYTMMYFNKLGIERSYRPSGFDSFTDLMSELPNISVSSDGPMAEDILRREAGSLMSTGNIAYCSCRVTEDVLHSLLSIKQNRKNPLLFYIIPDDIYDEELSDLLAPLKMLEISSIPYYVISPNSELRKAK